MSRAEDAVSAGSKLPNPESGAAAMRTPTLTFRGRDEIVRLQRGATVFGRSTSCEIVLDDPLVSRRHAMITVSTNEVVLEDLGSVNGVYVNGAKVEGPRFLAE